MDDRYQIIKPTTQFPFGQQYLAEDGLISRKVQIHRFSQPGSDAPSDWQALYEDGSRALATLNLPGLPTIYDRGIDDEGPFLIRQLIEEHSLLSRLAEGPLGEFEAWELADQLLEIQTNAQPKAFFHGALTPERISYSTRPSGEKRYNVLDFGLSELENHTLGTAQYHGLPCLVSLEQAAGQRPSESSQIFSLGQLLYMSLSENHPFASNKVEDMPALHQSHPIASIASVRPEIPEPFSDWLAKMMSVDPVQRFATFSEAMKALPAPQAAAPAPVLADQTAAQNVLLTGQTTGHQPLAAAQVQTSPAVASIQAVQSGGVVDTLKQKPLLAGAVAAVLLLVVMGLFSLGSNEGNSGGESSNNPHIAQNEGVQEDEEASSVGGDDEEETGLKRGLVVALNFDDSIVAVNDERKRLEVLNSEPRFASGIAGSGLMVDASHYYRLKLKNQMFSSSASSFSVSCWIRNTSREAVQPAAVSYQPWKASNNRRVGERSDKSGDLWQWDPTEVAGSEDEEWSMLTFIFSRKNKQLTMYQDGKMIGSSETQSFKSLDDEDYLYIGCDSNKKYQFESPAVIDQFYVWNRKLSSKEVRQMYKEKFKW